MSIFGRAHGMGGGGGGAGPGGMLRTAVSRTVTAGVNLQDPISTSSATNSVTSPRSRAANNKSSHGGLAVYSDGPSPFSVAKSANPSWPSFDDNDWVSVNQNEIERAYGYGHRFYDDFNLGPVPSVDEVETAISSLKEAFEPEVYYHSQFLREKLGYNLNEGEALGYSMSNEIDIDWQEPLPPLSNRRRSQPSGCERVYEAFSMLRNEPYVQRMVISLSSDEAIWDCVQNNKVVREIRELFYAAEDNAADSSDETSNDPNPTMNFVSWILDNTKARVMEMFETISNLVNELFKLPNDDKATKVANAKESFDEKLRTSFMLTIMVLLVVVVTRAHRA